MRCQDLPSRAAILYSEKPILGITDDLTETGRCPCSPLQVALILNNTFSLAWRGQSQRMHTTITSPCSAANADQRENLEPINITVEVLGILEVNHSTKTFPCRRVSKVWAVCFKSYPEGKIFLEQGSTYQ